MLNHKSDSRPVKISVGGTTQLNINITAGHTSNKYHSILTQFLFDNIHAVPPIYKKVNGISQRATAARTL